jgi:anti-sigma regulatory factor (Ser/Thr protein kinase)
LTIETRDGVEPRDHVVLFYESDDELALTVGQFLTAGLLADECALVVATSAHIEGFEAAMVRAGVDVGQARTSGRLLTVEAGEVMAQLLGGDRPDADAFITDVDEIVRRMSDTGRRVRVFGEIVALLWDAGQVAAAIELEDVWNDFGRLVPFSLFCAYRAESVSGDHHEQSFDQLCHSHSAVVGAKPNRSTPVRTTAVGRAEAARSFGCDSRQLGAARRFVVDILTAWNLRGHAEDAAIVVSELATNAIFHARSDFIVAVSLLDATVRISVRDASRELPVVRDPSPTTVSGRGLVLVDAIAQRWGTEPLVDGKLIWVELHP